MKNLDNAFRLNYIKPFSMSSRCAARSREITLGDPTTMCQSKGKSLQFKLSDADAHVEQFPIGYNPSFTIPYITSLCRCPHNCGHRILFSGFDFTNTGIVGSIRVRDTDVYVCTYYLYCAVLCRQSYYDGPTPRPRSPVKYLNIKNFGINVFLEQGTRPNG
jgi:hypothetical protein